jgi:hypothetical protein
MATKKSKRGRKPNPSSKSGQIRELLKSGMKPMDIAKQLECAPALVYNVKARETGGIPTKAAPKLAKAASTTMASAGGLSGLGDILAAVQSGEKDRIKMRRALEQIQAVIASALS